MDKQEVQAKHDKIRDILIDHGNEEFGDCIVDELCQVFDYPTTVDLEFEIYGNKDFIEWVNGDDVIKNKDGTYSTQDALYKNKLKNWRELKHYFRKKFYQPR